MKDTPGQSEEDRYHLAVVKLRRLVAEAWVRRAAAGLALVLLALFLLVKDGEQPNANTALVALLIAIFIAFFDPVKFLEGLSELSAGPVKLRWSLAAKRAAAETAHEGGKKEHGDETAAGGEGGADERPSAAELRLKLEAKLTYLAKHQLAADGKATFVTIGSLLVDGGLTKEQAETADRLLTASELTIEAQDEDFRQGAETLVDNFRATVHYNLTASKVKKAAAQGEWSVVEIKEAKAARPFLHVERGDGQTFRIAAPFSLTDSSKNLQKAAERLGQSAQRPPATRTHVIVVPDNSRATGKGLGIPVKHLCHIAKWLEKPADAYHA